MNCSFSRKHYVEALERAQAAYDILLFREWRSSGGRPRLFLRHDLDHSLRVGLDMAHLEHASGVRGTYFVQLHAELYGVSSASSADAIREIAALGHEIGLHFDAGYYQRLSLDPAEALRADIAQLSKIAGTTVESASRHSPVDSPAIPDLRSVVTWDAYSGHFLREIRYLSDSNRTWREGCFCTRLERGEEMHVLTHPIWWLADGETMRGQILAVARTDAEVSLTEALRTASYYEDCLTRRAELDRRLSESGF